MKSSIHEVRLPEPLVGVSPLVWTEVPRLTPQRRAWVVLAAMLTAVVAAIAVAAGFDPARSVSLSPATDFARPGPDYFVPEPSIRAPLDPTHVYPGWCRPATAPICQEI
jgi:hypothetical protein